MRFVPIFCITEGSILGKSLYGVNGEVLLNAGTKLRASYIVRLQELGMQGAYIDDDLSSDLEIVHAITDELRIKAIRGLKAAFVNVSHSKREAAESRISMRGHAEDIVDEILGRQSLVVNMMDIKSYDDYTFYHCVNVAVLSVLAGINLEFSREKLVKLAYSALLHDIGKVFIPTDIINKRSALTPDEYALVKKHPKDGYLYLRETYQMTDISARGVLQHHERYNGSGYPKGLVGNDISEFGRIIAVCDVFDALVSDRSYRKGLFAVEAMEYLLGGSGRLFDPEVVRVFSRRVALFPVGTCVLLSNGCTGIVLENFDNFAQRPLLKVFMTDALPVQPYLLDLCHDHATLDITIVATVAM